jgi:hypothetical protein
LREVRALSTKVAAAAGEPLKEQVISIAAQAVQFALRSSSTPRFQATPPWNLKRGQAFGLLLL